MFWIIISFFVLSATGGAAYIYTRADSPKISYICSALGLQAFQKDANSTPFYKWSWDRDSDDQISAQHIIQKSFHDSQVWLDDSDLTFFQTQCNSHQPGSKIDEAAIHQRVSQIVERTDLLHQKIAQKTEDVIKSVQSLSETEAREQLRLSGIHADSGKAMQQHCSLELKKLLYRLGLKVMGHKGRGITIHDPNFKQVFQMRGLDIWEQCLNGIKNELNRWLISRKNTTHPSIIRSLKATMKRGIVKDIEEDISFSRTFREDIQDSINKELLNLTPSQIYEYEQIMYSWKFSKKINFKQADHNSIRNLLSNNQYPACFRQIVINSINSNHESLSILIDSFPRKVIFYGSQNKARTYAMDQYSSILQALINALSNTCERMQVMPLLIEIPDDEIEQIRCRDDDAPENELSVPIGKQPKKIPTLDKLISKHQRLALIERKMKKEDGDELGWIINLPIPDMDPVEFEDLQNDYFKEFIRFFCDTSSKSDFDNQSEDSMRKRIKFFNRVLESIMNGGTKQENQSEIDQFSGIAL